MQYLQCIFDLRFNRGFVLFTDLDYRVIVTFIHQHLGLNFAIVYACSKACSSSVAVCLGYKYSLRGFRYQLYTEVSNLLNSQSFVEILDLDERIFLNLSE